MMFENLFYDFQHFDAGDVYLTFITSHADYFCLSYSSEICQSQCSQDDWYCDFVNMFCK